MTFARSLSLVGLLLVACAPGGGTPDAGDVPNGDGGQVVTDGGNTGGNGTSKTIGPAGGNLNHESQAVLQVPAGAVASDIEFAIAPASGIVPPEGVTLQSGVYQFGPSGTTFTLPVTVGFALNSPANANTKVYWTKPGSTTEFDALPATQVNALLVTAGVSHFSFGFVGTTGGGSTGGCTALDDLTNAFRTRYPPLRTAAGAGGKLYAGPSGALYVVTGTQLLAAADGRHFESIDGLSGSGSGRFVDEKQDWIYQVQRSGNDMAIQRRRASGCWENAGTLAAAQKLDIVAATAGGDLIGMANLRDGRSVIVHGAGGTTWTVKGEFPNYAEVTAAVAPSDANRIYIGYTLSGAHLRASTDGGMTWGNAVRVTAQSVSKLGTIAVDPTDPNLVYVIGEDGLYKSTDGGATIGKDADQPAGQPTFLRITADRKLWATTGPDATSLGEGLVNRAHGSTGWTQVKGNLPEFELLGSGFAILEGTPLKLFRHGATGSVWKSLDGGATWTNDTLGLVGLKSHPHLTDPRDENIFYAADRPGIAPGDWLRTTDGGATWTRFNIGDYGIPGRLLVMGSGTLVAFAQIVVNDAPHLGARSTDGGQTFTPVSGFTFEDGPTLGGQFGAIGSESDDNVWPDVDPVIAYARGQNAGLFRTIDDGATWTRVTTLSPTIEGRWYPVRLVVDPVVSKRLIKVISGADAVPSSAGISTDGGSTWTDIPMPTDLLAHPYDFAIDAQGRVWMTGTTKSFTQGVWTIEPGTSTFVAKTVSGVNAGELRVFGGFLYIDEQRTADGGATWSTPSFTDPLPDQFDVLAFTHRANPKRVLFNLPALRSGLMP